MANNSVIDWRGAFSVPTVKEVREQRDVANLELINNIEVVGKNDKKLKSARNLLLGVATGFLAVKGVSLVEPAYYHILPSEVVEAFRTSVNFIYDNFGPVVAYANNGDASSWYALVDKVLWITDKLMSGVVIFSGISWMFGNRTKAIELLFGAAVGFIIIMHHQDIKNFIAMI